MSLTSAMFTGVSGLLNNAEGINVIGNNISNVNTIGFKGSRMLFSDVLSTTIGSGSQMGHGVQIQKVDNMFTQSSLETTAIPTDVAIQGDNFFILAKPGTTAAAAITPESAYYTRAGAFRVDTNRALINPDNFNVLGSDGIPVVFNQYAAASGTNQVVTPAAVAAAAAYNPATAYVPGNVVTYNGLNYVNLVGATGAQPDISPANWSEVLTFQKVTNIDAKGNIALLYANTTGNSATVYYNGNGAPPLSSGNTVFLGTARVDNPPGLEKVGGTLFRQTGAVIGGSGVPTFQSANGTTNKILGNNLELSNVDMATEFVKMILTQRAYSANSKTITTTDEMTQEVLNLKR